MVHKQTAKSSQRVWRSYPASASPPSRTAGPLAVLPARLAAKPFRQLCNLPRGRNPSLMAISNTRRRPPTCSRNSPKSYEVKTAIDERRRVGLKGRVAGQRDPRQGWRGDPIGDTGARDDPARREKLGRARGTAGTRSRLRPAPLRYAPLCGARSSGMGVGSHCERVPFPRMRRPLSKSSVKPSGFKGCRALSHDLCQ